MPIYIDLHQAMLKQVGDVFLDTQSQLPNHYLNRLNPAQGNGYRERYDFGKLCVGKGKYWLHHPLTIKTKVSTHIFGITILLSGTHYIKNHQSNIKYEIRSPMIILRKGNLGVQTIYLPANKNMSLISLDFNESLLPVIGSTFEQHELATFFLNTSMPAIKTIHIPNKDVLHQAHYLLNAPPAQSSINLLHLEGAALELLSLILHKNTQIDQIPALIQETINILENQFENKITIRHLSKMVGTNECDLKRLFKEHTGKTIGEFLLSIRMRHAQILLKEGISVENTANRIGYSSSQYFKQIFERYFGYSF
ncbi:helix-turn-helix transcriptional regulator [Acinetobacter larvae]|uniref:AraC family transcriptional regulator n=1 Tax=Acinetobacter larvae TaxID=1789224 RepID=A0A1B2LWI7_9GAMM|nr:helix-turn-helix transcriptional regulator [Acinetobacter larvae]AOA57301.1 AraC family transcriptional regulator [Acinetobacter larvae]